MAFGTSVQSFGSACSRSHSRAADCVSVRMRFVAATLAGSQGVLHFCRVRQWHRLRDRARRWHSIATRAGVRVKATLRAFASGPALSWRLICALQGKRYGQMPAAVLVAVGVAHATHRAVAVAMPKPDWAGFIEGNRHQWRARSRSLRWRQSLRREACAPLSWWFRSPQFPSRVATHRATSGVNHRRRTRRLCQGRHLPARDKGSGNVLPRFAARRKIPAQAVGLEVLAVDLPSLRIEDSEHATPPLRHSEPLRVKHAPFGEAVFTQRHAFRSSRLAGH